MKAWVIYNKRFNVQQFILLYVAVMLVVVAVLTGLHVATGLQWDSTIDRLQDLII